ncbi:MULTISPECIES: hypothetical protein [Clostridium]|uniref:Uncharacterized protein n=1 Tax=Clostridium frigoriphilum TaxID=443253 RepID=A0ABU7UVY3_9CLOT|nr:hypothetical protein [Clostridium sp. DSM 17811]MBU3102377.1 hypothetical protein [Clostridium sp. DSM 17811]
MNKGMNINMHKKLIALCLICSVVGSSTIAFATTNNSTLSNDTSIQNTTSTTIAANQLKVNPLSQASIDKVDKYVVVENNQFVLKLPISIQNQISISELAKINERIKQSNDKLRTVTRDNSITVNKNVINVLPVTSLPETSAISTMSIGSYEGVTAFNVYWWGYGLRLSKSVMNTIDIAAKASAKYGTGAVIIVLQKYFPSLPGALAGYVAGILVSRIKVTPGNYYAMWAKSNLMGQNLTTGYQYSGGY